MEEEIFMTLPIWDEVTEYLSAFSRELISICKARTIIIKFLEGKDVIRKEVESRIRKNTKMLIFNGHGSPDCIAGYKNDRIVSLGVNEYLLKNRITYARSCWSLGGLGETMRDEKKGCFIGYSLPFQFTVEISRISNPLKDKTAKIFFDTANLVPIGLIKGNTAGESNENSKRSMLKAINKILANGDYGSEAIAEALWNNYIGQDIIGNAEERLS